jgi:hypothetical protein
MSSMVTRITALHISASRQPWHHRVFAFSSDSAAEPPPWVVTAVQIKIDDLD